MFQHIKKEHIHDFLSHHLPHSQSLQSDLASPAILKDAWQLIELFDYEDSTSRVSPGVLKFSLSETFSNSLYYYPRIIYRQSVPLF